MCARADFLGAYFRIHEAGLDPATEPGPWEYLAGRCQEAGRKEIAHRIRWLLWETGNRTDDVTLGESRFALENGRSRLAAYFIEEVFGDEPDDPEARVLLASAYAVEYPQRAYDLVRDQAADDPDLAVLAIDILRGDDQLKIALEATKAAIEAFPDEQRLRVRLARVLESLGEWHRALEQWQWIAGAYPDAVSMSLMNQVRLYLRLDQRDQAISAAAAHTLLGAPLGERIAVAFEIEQDWLIPILLDQAARRPAAGEVTAREWSQIARNLIDQGRIGLAEWLARKDMPIGHEARAVLEAVEFSAAETAAIDADPYSAASVISPNCLLPLSRLLGPDWIPPSGKEFDPQRDQIMLVNSTLAAGGAERQLVATARALLRQGLTPERLHVALYSVAADRGHAHFLQEMQSLGVQIHTLATRTPRLSALPEHLSHVFSALPTPLRQDAVALWLKVREVGPQILHGWQDRAALACGIVGYLQSVHQVVLSVRNMNPATRDYRAGQYGAHLMSALSQLANMTVTANSDPGARDYESWLGLGRGAVKVVRNGLDVPEFALSAPWAQTGRNGSRVLRIGGVFRLSANKRPRLWMETVAALRAASAYEIRPVLIGSGPFLEEILAAKTELGLDDLSVESGLDRPEDIYSRFDVMLLMSRVEGTPNVLIEAQACGIPVAACDVGGAGLLLHPEIGAHEAASRIESWLPGALAADPAERRAFVQGAFSIEALGERTLRLYTRAESDWTEY